MDKTGKVESDCPPIRMLKKIDQRIFCSIKSIATLATFLFSLIPALSLAIGTVDVAEITPSVITVPANTIQLGFVDTDGDGLSDAFEIANGLDPLDAAGVNGALGDADGDGFTNLEEQTFGSDASAATGAGSNSGFISFSNTTYSVDEDAGTLSVSVTRSGSVGAVSVLCFSTDIASQAMAGIDYTAISATLNWADGDASSKTCSISITSDSEAEGNISGAMLSLNGVMRYKYQTAFTNSTTLQTVIPKLGTIEGGSITGDTAEFIIVRQENGQPVAFKIYLVRDGDGIWRIAEM